MGSSLRGWGGAGWQSRVVGVAWAEAWCRPECWATCPSLWLLVSFLGHLSSSPCLPGKTWQFACLLCSQGAAMGQAQLSRCSHAIHKSEVRNAQRWVRRGPAWQRCQLLGPFSRGSCGQGAGVAPYGRHPWQSVRAERTAVTPWPGLQGLSDLTLAVRPLHLDLWFP